nr:ribose-phosphate pyrophosphokinase [uncultured Ligilactobacillus sp.]
MRDNTGIKLFALNSNPKLSKKIAEGLGVEICATTVHHFSDGEIQINIDQSVRGCDVFVIQSISDPVNENFMELMIMIDALRRASAGTINCVIPYYGYARADRKTRSREPITAKLIANFLTMAGADRIITLDLHAGQLQGFFNIPMDHLVAIYDQVKYIKQQKLDQNVVVVAPDHSSVKLARNLAELLKAPIVIVDKRDKNRINLADTGVIGDVAGRRCIVYDDLIDTGSKMVDAAAVLKNAGASEIYGLATHPILSGDASKELQDSALKKVIVTDTIQIPEEKQFDKLETVSVASIFADAISLIYHNQSVDALFNKDDSI